MTPATTDKSFEEFLGQVQAIGDAIRALGPLPSGELYARVCSHLDPTYYQRVIDTLKNVELIREQGNLLTWTGPDWI